MIQTLNWKLAKNMKVCQVSSQSEVVLPRPPQCPEDVWPTYKDGLGDRFRGSTDVVKRPRMDLKLGIPSRFGPISSLKHETPKIWAALNTPS